MQEERGKVDSVTTLSELFSAAAKKEPKLGDNGYLSKKSWLNF